MASLTNSTNIATTNSNLNLHTCSFTVSVVEKSGSASVSGNYSYVTVTYSATCTTSGRTFAGTSRPDAGYLSITVNGTVQTVTVPFPNGATNGTVLASGSYDQKVNHDSSGAKTITIKLKMNSGTDPYNYGVVWNATSEQSTTLALTTIKRGATITVFNNFTIENGFSFTYVDYVSSHAQRITVRAGSSSILTLTLTSSAGTHTRTIQFNQTQLDWVYRALGPTAKSATFTVLIETTMSGTTISSSKTATGTLLQSANMPTIGNVGIEETALAPYGVSNLDVVRYLSVKLIQAEVSAQHYANVASVKVINGTRSVAMTLSGALYEASVSNFQSGDITIEVTDSRGYTTGVVLQDLTLIEYTYPSITAVAFDRTNAISTTGFIRPQGAFWNGTAGTTTNAVSWKYSLNGGTFVDAQTVTVTGSTWAGDESLPANTLIRTESYTCVVRVTDAFGQTADFTVTLGVAELSIWIGKNTVRAKHFIAGESLAVETPDPNDPTNTQRIVLDASTITVVKSAIVYSSTSESLATSSGNTISFSLPTDFKQSLGCVLSRCWPHTNWTNGALVTIAYDKTYNGEGTVQLTTNSAQTYDITIRLNYIADIAS